MEWNPVLEQRLKTARGKAGWRWIGYIGVAFGLLVFVGGGVAANEAKAACQAEAAPGETCEANMAVYLAPGGVIAILGIVLAVPAEKSAKEAKELRAQKNAAQQATSKACPDCGAGVIGRFCADCGTAAA